jgi:hypothetical protein
MPEDVLDQLKSIDPALLTRMLRHISHSNFESH